MGAVHTQVPPKFIYDVERFAQEQAETLRYLTQSGYSILPYPEQLPTGNSRGVAAAIAYPMQGVLKYHGLSDWQARIAYLPTISLNSDSAHSLTLVEFDSHLAADALTLNQQVMTGRPLARVSETLDFVRQLAGITSYARVISQNVVRARITGKGLGTSAAGGAALAMAALGAAFGAEIAQHTRFASTIARRLAGSGCRSLAGGLALWLSYPGCPDADSFALRLDNQGELDDVCLLTVPLNSRVGLQTEMAHADAPHSPFFRTWVESRHADLLECIQAVQKADWQTIGALAELDSIRLHGVTMSGSRGHKLYGWEPENIHFFRACNELRDQGFPVYFSTDTGPTMVFITHQKYLPTVKNRLQSIVDELQLETDLVVGKIAGPAQLIPVETARQALERPPQ
jgi:diphosphomevalonate decarboxylase